jgi:competence protein ComEA
MFEKAQRIGVIFMLCIMIFLGSILMVKKLVFQVVSKPLSKFDTKKELIDIKNIDEIIKKESKPKIKKDLHININTASIGKLMELPGIGKVMAKRIIEYRKKQPIRTYQDLLNIKGIGRKKLKKLEKFLNLPIGSETKAAVFDNKAKSFDIKNVNINTTSIEKLMELPGIGKVIAQRIIEYRKTKKFTSFNQLLEIKGIGKKKLEKLKEYIKFHD